MLEKGDRIITLFTFSTTEPHSNVEIKWFKTQSVYGVLSQYQRLFLFIFKLNRYNIPNISEHGTVDTTMFRILPAKFGGFNYHHPTTLMHYFVINVIR